MMMAFKPWRSQLSRAVLRTNMAAAARRWPSPAYC